MSEVFLQARDITVRFGGLTAVDGVSADFRAGELVGIIGPNGAGKTTFFNAISGVTPATSGKLLMQGRETIQANDWARSGQWAQKGEYRLNRKMSGGKVGIVGLGRIGKGANLDNEAPLLGRIGLGRFGLDDGQAGQGRQSIDGQEPA